MHMYKKHPVIEVSNLMVVHMMAVQMRDTVMVHLMMVQVSILNAGKKIMPDAEGLRELCKAHSHHSLFPLSV